MAYRYFVSNYLLFIIDEVRHFKTKVHSKERIQGKSREREDASIFVRHFDIVVNNKQ